jgi:ribosomal protein S18 acetylase RimI-like enzyme
MSARPETDAAPGPVGGVSSRAGRIEDYDFALALYLESTKPLMIALGRWDEERILNRFADGFKVEQVQALCEGDAVIGWMQVSETDAQLHLDQLHLVTAARNRGLGTRLIRELQERARASGRSLALNVIRGNRAQALYERLGFLVVGSEDEEKIQMRWRTGGDGAYRPSA